MRGRAALQPPRGEADAFPMISVIRRRLPLLLMLLVLVASGCVLPRRGTPVFVDARAGKYWSGRGMLIEVSEDQARCRVAVRDRALVVKRPWVDCQWVHRRVES